MLTKHKTFGKRFPTKCILPAEQTIGQCMGPWTMFALVEVRVTSVVRVGTVGLYCIMKIAWEAIMSRCWPKMIQYPQNIGNFHPTAPLFNVNKTVLISPIVNMGVFRFHQKWHLPSCNSSPVDCDQPELSPSPRYSQHPSEIFDSFVSSSKAGYICRFQWSTGLTFQLVKGPLSWLWKERDTLYRGTLTRYLKPHVGVS